MTQWVENPTGGRDRGPVALARAWGEAIVRPRRLFRSAVAPGDQAPGLLFAATVVLVAEATRVAFGVAAYPEMGGRPVASTVFWLGIGSVLVAPAVLHLVAALQTVLLVAFVDDRAGVSETVQVIAYAAAPCAFSSVPVPEVRLLAAAYGGILLAIGTAEVHDVPTWKAAVLTAVPSALVFGYGFRGFAALSSVTGLT